MKIAKEELLLKIDASGVKLAYLNELIGGYRGKLTEWKKGKTSLSQEEMKIINDYLDSKPIITESALTEDELKLINSYRQLSEQDKPRLLGYADCLESEQD